MGTFLGIYGDISFVGGKLLGVADPYSPLRYKAYGVKELYTPRGEDTDMRTRIKNIFLVYAKQKKVNLVPHQATNPHQRY